MKSTGKKLMFNYIVAGFLLGAFSMILQLFIFYGYVSHQRVAQLLISYKALLIFSISPVFFAFIGWQISRSKIIKQRLSRRLRNAEDERKDLQHELSEYQYALDLCAITTIIDADGKIKKVNNNFLAFTGYSAEEITGRSVWRMPSSLQKPGVFEDIKNTIDSGKVWTGEIEYYKSKASTAFTKATVVPLLQKQQNSYDCLVIQYDITPEKNIELALRKSEKEKSIIISNTQTLICTHDLEGKLTSINKTGAEILGYAPEDIIGKPLQAFLDSRYLMGEYLNTIKDNGSSSGYMKIVTSSNQKRTLLYKNVTCTDQEQTYIIGSALDVTESIEAKRTIDDQKAFISRIVDESANMICVTDEDNRIAFLNIKLKSFFNINEHENIETLEDAIDKIKEFKTLTNFAGGHENSLNKYSMHECKITQPITGDVRWFKVQRTTFGDNKKKFSLIIATDISEMHATQLELIEARQSVENSLKIRENFISNMSHEIRTPLNAIIGFSELLKDTSLNIKQADYLKTINVAGQNLLGIINDILDLSRLEAGQIQIASNNINLPSVVANIRKLFEPRILEKQIDFVVSVGANIPENVMCDEVRLNQVLINLAGNAIKFTNKGRVEIELRSAGCNNGKHHVQFLVKDTGIGIEKDKLDVIFQRYSQASKDIHRLYGGTGLGLSISKSLIELLGGEIKLSSERGVGTIFSFILPFELPPIVQEVPVVILQNNIVPNKGLRILLAEDNMTNAKLAMQILIKQNYFVHHVKDGTKVLDTLKDNYYDIILMDVQMIELDGVETAEMIRMSRTAYSNIPIIALTAHSFKGEKDICTKVGMNAYVSKPYRPQELLQCIERTMALHNSGLLIAS